MLMEKNDNVLFPTENSSSDALMLPPGKKKQTYTKRLHQDLIHKKNIILILRYFG